LEILLPFAHTFCEIGSRIGRQRISNFLALTKFVDKQYMGNIDSEDSVLAYSQTDLNVQYTLDLDSFVKKVLRFWFGQ
jgi:hypothetical protein